VSATVPLCHITLCILYNLASYKKDARRLAGEILLVTMTNQGETTISTHGLVKTHNLLSRLLGIPLDTWIYLSANFWRFDSG
jgi:hypothetical protein